MWIDSHAHLYDFDEREVEELLAEARRESVSCVLSTATSLQTAQKVISQCSSFKEIYGAVGISPFDVESLDENWETELCALLDNPGIIAVGEIGIDNTNPSYPPLQKQIPVFKKQLTIAREIDKPAVIHSRGAEIEALEICMELGIKKVLFHCFTGSRDSLLKIIEAGYCISFSGIVTFKNSPLTDLVPLVPDDRLFIETDTPYLAPVPFRGKRNRPGLVRYTGEKIAEIREVTSEKLMGIMEENFGRFFGVNTVL